MGRIRGRRNLGIAEDLLGTTTKKGPLKGPLVFLNALTAARL